MNDTEKILPHEKVYPKQNPILPDTEKQKISAEIINILSYQQVITNQGINYTGEKDWALNKILALLDKTIKSKLEAVEGAVKGMDEEFIMKPNYSDMQNGIAFVPKKIVLEIINKHK